MGPIRLAQVETRETGAKKREGNFMFAWEFTRKGDDDREWEGRAVVFRCCFGATGEPAQDIS